MPDDIEAFDLFSRMKGVRIHNLIFQGKTCRTIEHCFLGAVGMSMCVLFAVIFGDVRVLPSFLGLARESRPVVCASFFRRHDGGYAAKKPNGYAATSLPFRHSRALPGNPVLGEYTGLDSRGGHENDGGDGGEGRVKWGGFPA